MKINLFEDYIDMQAKRIRDKKCFHIPKNMDDRTIIIKYIEFLRKTRFTNCEIKKSKNFHCPSNKQKGFENLCDVFVNGGDVIPYLSKSSLDFNKSDGLFADWGILHFHLGELKIGENFVTRDGPILFVFQHEEFLFLINVYDHNSWTNKEVLQDMFDNWPELFSELVGITPNDNISANDIREFRKWGINTAIGLKTPEGKLIAVKPKYQTITTDQVSSQDYLEYDFVQSKIKLIQEWVISNTDVIIKKLGKNNIDMMPENINIKILDYNQGRIVLYAEPHIEIKFSFNLN